MSQVAHVPSGFNVPSGTLAELRICSPSFTVVRLFSYIWGSFFVCRWSVVTQSETRLSFTIILSNYEEN